MTMSNDNATNAAVRAALNTSSYACMRGRRAFLIRRETGYWPPGDCSNFQETVNGPLAALTILSGLSANLFCLAVFLRPRAPPRIYQYLIGLVVWDNLLLLSAFFLNCLPTLLYGCIVSYGTYVYFYPYWYCLGNVTLVGCVWIVLALAFDRTFALYRPILHKSLQSRRRTRAIILSISFAAIVYGLPRFFELAVKLCPEDVANGLPPIPVMAVTPFRDHFAHKLYKVGGGLIFYSLVPFVVLLVLTLLLLAHLRRARVQLQKLSATHAPSFAASRKDSSPVNPGHHGTGAPGIIRRRSRSRGGSALLAVISAKFLLSRTLPMSLDLAESAMGLARLQSTPWVIPLVTLSNYLVVINSATNLICYLICGSQFRRQSLALLRRLTCIREHRQLERRDSTRYYDFSETTGSALTTAPSSPNLLRPALHHSGSSSPPKAKSSRSSVPSVSFDERLNRSFVYLTPYRNERRHRDVNL